jgi:hypothetical protein
VVVVDTSEVVKVVTTITIDETTTTMATRTAVANKCTTATVDVIHEVEAMEVNNNAVAAVAKVMVVTLCTTAIRTIECERIKRKTKTERQHIRQTERQYV